VKPLSKFFNSLLVDVNPLASNRCIEFPFLSSQECDDIIKYACDKKQSFSISDVELNNDVYTRDQVTTANFFKYNFFSDHPDYIDRFIGVLKKSLPWLVYPIAVQAWVNIYNTGEGIKWHIHDGLNSHSYTINIFVGGETKPGTSYMEPGSTVTTIENKLGGMIISNCSLWHMVTPNESKITRYSIGITIHDYEAITQKILKGVSFNTSSQGVILLTD